MRWADAQREPFGRNIHLLPGLPRREGPVQLPDLRDRALSAFCGASGGVDRLHSRCGRSDRHDAVDSGDSLRRRRYASGFRRIWDF